MAKPPYELKFGHEIRAHLKAIDAKYHALILQTIDEQLEFEPNVETRNRKPLRTPAAFSAHWEIRLGPQNRFRVLYGVDEEERTVHVLAIGEKRRNRLIVGGEEIEL
ncbi:MAG TPA: type II toxin-antitoxin system RelE/ParE family toxin [Pirellulales bacterium]|nr:type II toxin-antitoxin system RelE/ParE family toxin [Pirellulales bacterium]